MRTRFPRILAGLIVAFCLAAPAQADTVRIGWTAWADAEFVTKLAARIIEDRFETEVDLVQTDIAPQYTGVAQGDLDFMLMSWQPVTHEDYIERYGPRLVSIGIIYDRARLGWVVPDYMYEAGITSIEDLNDSDVRDRLGGEITGIDPGAGLTRLSHDTIEQYGLDGYELLESSDAGMTAALRRAIRRDNWIVVTGWSPHWKFGAHELRYLDDPKGVLGGPERIHIIARQNFYGEHEEIASFLARMYLPIEQLQEYMFIAEDSSYEDAVKQYISDNGSRVEYWVTGEL